MAEKAATAPSLEGTIDLPPGQIVENLSLSFDDLPSTTTSEAEDLNDPSNFQKPPPSQSIGSGDADERYLCKKTAAEEDNAEEYILGTLVVRVIAARNLEPMHNDGLGKFLFGNGRNRYNGQRGGRRGSSSVGVNPYASVRFGKTAQRTSEVFDSVDPVWPRGETTMYMDVTHPPSSDEGLLDNANEREEEEAKEGGGGVVNEESKPERPILTVALFHSNEIGRQQKYNPTKGFGSGDSDDQFLGAAAVDLTQLLTGKIGQFDDWLPLSGGPGGSQQQQQQHQHHQGACVRVVAEYESSDPPPERGDVVRFSGFCNDNDLYPAQPGRSYMVEERVGDSVLISWTSPEGWISTLSAHRYMLICSGHEHGPIEICQEELASLTERLSHSPLVSAVQGTVRRVPDEGLISVGVDVFHGGRNLLARWLESGVGTAIGDLTYATNWDGQFNPSDEANILSTSDADEDQDGTIQEAPRGQASTLDLEPTPGAAAAAGEAALLPNMPLCPITGDRMRDPVVAADGHTYERSAIARWLTTSNKSPLTGSVLPHKDLAPNYMLCSLASSLQDRQGAADAAAAAVEGEAPADVGETKE